MVPPGRILTEEIRDNLIAKANFYMNSIQEDRNKVMIFTDNAALWKENVNTIIRTDIPLPPIPDNYVRSQATYDIVDEMQKYIGEYIRPAYRCRKTSWCACNLGDEDRPQVHIIFASHSLQEAASVLLKTPGSRSMKWCQFPDGDSTSSSSSSIVSYCGSSSFSSMDSTGTTLESFDSVDEVFERSDSTSREPAAKVQCLANPLTGAPEVVLVPPTPSPDELGFNAPAFPKNAPRAGTSMSVPDIVCIPPTPPEEGPAVAKEALPTTKKGSGAGVEASAGNASAVEGPLQPPIVAVDSSSSESESTISADSSPATT